MTDVYRGREGWTQPLDEEICYLTTTISSILISSFDIPITPTLIMINKGDRIISMLLLNSHESDMTYQRPDKTTYVCQIRKDKPNTFFIPQTQLELNLDLPTSPKPKVNPRKSILKQYYGEDWKPIPVPNLAPHL